MSEQLTKVGLTELRINLVKLLAEINQKLAEARNIASLLCREWPPIEPGDEQ